MLSCPALTPSPFPSGLPFFCISFAQFFGFVDDIEFLFLPDGSSVEYRSASRMGENDFKANRTRIRDLRVALKPDGWKSLGF